MVEQTPITKEMVKENKERFVSLLAGVAREGVDGLLDWLQKTDFFVAPASTRYHESYEGGLCQHSLAVYDALSKLNADNAIGFGEDEMKLCALLHDLCKAQFYKETTRNVKNDDTGKWEKVPYYTVEDAFPYGHGEKSVYCVERYVRLKPTEALAIRWHMGGFDDSVKGGSYSLSNAFNSNKFIAALHIADMMATYL